MNKSKTIYIVETKDGEYVSEWFQKDSKYNWLVTNDLFKAKHICIQEYTQIFKPQGFKLFKAAFSAELTPN